MIRKELDPLVVEDKFARSGRAAEEQMAFYFKRFFERKQDIHVLNGIRLVFDGDAAQIDHLIIHPYGFVIVESKSVQGKIQMKDDGQWIRWFGDNQSKGMASPITQAQLQIEFLKSALGRATGASSIFDTIPFDLIVAISNSGVILWPKSGAIPEVCKADQVPDKINQKIEALGTARNKTPLFSAATIEKIVQYLLLSHQPLVIGQGHKQTEATKPPVVNQPPIQNPPEPVKLVAEIPAKTETEICCKHCSGLNLQIRFGHTYYFYCNDCKKNTSIRSSQCATCGENKRIRKSGLDYFSECQKCGLSKLYFQNKE
jgi:hypothetical protein